MNVSVNSESMAEVERRHILATVHDCGGNKTRAAKVLGLSVRGLRLKMIAYGGHSAEGTSQYFESIFRPLDILPSPIAVLDRKGGFIATNRAWKTVAQSAELPTSSSGLNYLKECEAASARGNLDARNVLTGLNSVSRGKTDKFTYVYECPIAGLVHWIQVDVVPRASGGLVVIHNDVSSLEYDAECQLPNDRFYHAQLQYAISEATERGGEFVCLLVVLKDTERAERIFGPGALVEAAREIATRLVNGTRGKQFVARISPCEFGIIWTGPAADRDERAAQVAQLLKRPILFEKTQLTGISAVVGASSFPKDGTTVPALLSVAKTDQTGAAGLM